LKIIISYFLEPLTIFFLLLIASAIFHKLKKKRVTFLLIWAAALWMLLISTSFVPDFLMKNLEKHYPVFQENQLNEITDSVNILVLGSGHVNDERLEAYHQLGETSVSRLFEGIRIHKLHARSRLITSGFKGKEELSNAEVTAITAISFGVDPSIVYQQRSPENTHEEALAYKEVFGTETQLILVTSAAHMKRSMKLFEKAGLNPIAAPTNFLYKKSKSKHPFRWIPYGYNIKKMESAMHEYIGIVYSKLTNRI